MASFRYVSAVITETGLAAKGASVLVAENVVATVAESVSPLHTG